MSAITEKAPDSCPFCGASVAIHDGNRRRCDNGEWAHYECGTWVDVGLDGGVGGTTIKCRIAERERLTRERDEVFQKLTEMAFKAGELTARVKRLEEALGSIREYWNRDNNEKAMEDACWHAINTANEALEAKESTP